ncbi:MAG: phosphatidylglycerol lysyltransferase domain-containing protein [Muribaculaceae bacterium]|nr:phosphatidylglycerol lysyltransferase domain-containing protein [Muribaculaceae bacterium]
METTLTFFPTAATARSTSPFTYDPEPLLARLRRAKEEREMERLRDSRATGIKSFSPVTHEAMAEIWPILEKEAGRTTDFSYGGLLMWVDYFKYEYAIVNDTLFIKGLVENDVTTPAFSLPVGGMPLADSVAMVRDYCRREGIVCEFSAVPEYAMPQMRALGPVREEELTDWADYLYEAAPLATLSGKKMAKKRNHVNKFLATNPDWELVELTPANVSEAREFMDVFDLEGDATPMAVEERKLTRMLIDRVAEGDRYLRGALLKTAGKVCAFTIGDIKGDTLFVHVEKATRAVDGSYEMINKAFAEAVCGKHPEVKYINREDDAGDEGLRKAKESYKPVEMLRKYNVVFA